MRQAMALEEGRRIGVRQQFAPTTLPSRAASGALVFLYRGVVKADAATRCVSSAIEAFETACARRLVQTSRGFRFAPRKEGPLTATQTFARDDLFEARDQAAPPDGRRRVEAHGGCVKGSGRSRALGDQAARAPPPPALACGRWRPPASPWTPLSPMASGALDQNLRISVTDRCNFRCVYCMPAEGIAWLPRAQILLATRRSRASRASAVAPRRRGAAPHRRRAARARRPAEPGRRCSRASRASTTSRSPPTASLLERLARDARRRPGSSASTSASTRSSASASRSIARRDALPRGARRARGREPTPGFTPIKVNAVAMRGFNEDEVARLRRAGAPRAGYVVRFIEFMPLDAGTPGTREALVPGAEIRARIDASFPLDAGRATDPHRAGAALRASPTARGEVGLHRPGHASRSARPATASASPPTARSAPASSRCASTTCAAPCAPAPATTSSPSCCAPPSAQGAEAPHQRRPLREARAHHVPDRRMTRTPCPEHPCPTSRVASRRRAARSPRWT